MHIFFSRKQRLVGDISSARPFHMKSYQNKLRHFAGVRVRIHIFTHHTTSGPFILGCPQIQTGLIQVLMETRTPMLCMLAICETSDCIHALRCCTPEEWNVTWASLTEQNICWVLITASDTHFAFLYRVE